MIQAHRKAVSAKLVRTAGGTRCTERHAMVGVVEQISTGSAAFKQEKRVEREIQRSSEASESWLRTQWSRASRFQPCIVQATATMSHTASPARYTINTQDCGPRAHIGTPRNGGKGRRARHTTEDADNPARTARPRSALHSTAPARHSTHTQHPFDSPLPRWTAFPPLNHHTSRPDRPPTSGGFLP